MANTFWPTLYGQHYMATDVAPLVIIDLGDDELAVAVPVAVCQVLVPSKEVFVPRMCISVLDM